MAAVVAEVAGLVVVAVAAANLPRRAQRLRPAAPKAVLDKARARGAMAGGQQGRARAVRGAD